VICDKSHCNDNNCWATKIIEVIQQFNYECPDCKGKFNNSVYVDNGTSAFVWKCPFCGRKMEGLN
jgi:ribosomal protein L37AE/L43A